MATTTVSTSRARKPKSVPPATDAAAGEEGVVAEAAKTVAAATPKATRSRASGGKKAAVGGSSTASSAPVFSVQDSDDVRSREEDDDDNVVLNLKIYEHKVMNAPAAGAPSNFGSCMLDDGTTVGMVGGLYCGGIMDSEAADYNSKPYELMGMGSENGGDIAGAFVNQGGMPPDVVAPEQEHQPAVKAGPVLKVIDLLKDFEEKNKHNEWPSNTSIACYWCCHKFNNTPFGIPVKYINERFHVYGCFCSLECCAAYNIDTKDAADDIWERASLINMLGRRLGYKNYIKPAPSKLSLKMFGGHMEIEEFRDYCKSNRIININFPPMMTLTQQIEEINEADINNDYRYIPIDTDRINKYKEKMKLKRMKPITNFKNTLDHTMNLKYGANGPIPSGASCDNSPL